MPQTGTSRDGALSILAERNIIILILAQVVFVSGSALMVTIGGIVGSQLSPDPALATLPVSLMVVGTACATVPASLLMQRFGRRAGFCFSAVNAAGGALLAAHAVNVANFTLFCVATAMLGTSLAFSQQFRFAAAESVQGNRINSAVSFILLGSIGGALLGPYLAANGASITPDSPFRGGLLVATGLYLAGALLLAGLRNATPALSESDASLPTRPLGEVIRQPLFLLAVGAGVVGQGVMVYIMTATPVSMHVIGPHDLEATASVIRAHIIAMYLPSLFSGQLISRFGQRRMMAIGACILLATIAMGLTGQQVMHYWFTMVLLGIGWNFLYVGGTTLLVQTYRGGERFRAQAVNEFSVFTTSAMVSLLAGSLMHSLGWAPLLLSVLPFLLAMLLAVFLIRHASASLAT